MENENLKPIEKLTPFTKMIMTIGELPSSFYSSMSYYESMVWLYEYLKNQVIPTVNNNAEAVEELQGKYIELKDYVTGKVDELETYMNNYFDNLDVQQEINNKLDEMAEDGTLTNLIKNYVDPIYQEYETTINENIEEMQGDISSFKTNVNTRLNSMNNEIQNVASGSPLVASSTSEMTDTTRIYVNTTDGKWYYYDGDSWEIGGTYQATEDSSTVTEIQNNLEALDYYTSTKTMFEDLEDITTLTSAQLREDGTTASSRNWYTTDYFDTKDIVKLETYALGNTSLLAIAYYDENKIFISGQKVSVNSTLELITAVIPENTKYCRLCFQHDGGSEASQYVTFETSEFQIDRENIKELQDYQNKLESVNAYNKTKTTFNNIGYIYEGYIDTNGVEQSTGSWYSSEYITLNNITSIKMYCGLFTNINAISYYDENKNYISGEHGESNIITLFTATIPDNAKYFRISMQLSQLANYYIITESSNILLDHNSLFNIKNVKVDELTISGYIDTNGKLALSTGWRATDFIPTYDVIHLKGKFYEYSHINYVSFYDEFKQYIADSGKAGRSNGSSYNEIINIPNNAKYFRLSFGASQDNTQYYETINDTIKSDILEKENNNNPLYGKTLLAVGDSITAGSDTNISYVDLIAYKNNMSFTNSAVWGATLASNVSGSSGAINEIISSMSNDADYIIISGGVNDYYYVNGGVEPEGTITSGTYGAYEENYDEDTFCGALESICSQAIAKWPGKKIIYVMTHRVLDTNVPNENIHAEMIRTILKKWGIPFVNLYEEMPSLFLSALKNDYSRNGDGLHPTTDGYKKFYVSPVESLLKKL